MNDENNIVRDRQKLIRREMERRHIAIKAVQLDAGWETPSTVLSYFPGDPDKVPATMSVAALYRLLKTNALPVDLLSLLLPDGFQIVRAAEDIDHDELCDWAESYVATKTKAHRADSPLGPEIAPCEKNELDGKVCALPLRKAA